MILKPRATLAHAIRRRSFMVKLIAITKTAAGVLLLNIEYHYTIENTLINDSATFGQIFSKLFGYAYYAPSYIIIDYTRYSYCYIYVIRG